MGEPLPLEDLASSISDGIPVDWAAERKRARDPGELKLVEALATLERIAVLVRSSPSSSPASPSELSTIEEQDALLGTLIGPYRIDEFVGRGGMGLVYRASDTRLHRTVALKLLAPELSADEAATRRFADEARKALRVSHPYVATVFDVAEQDGRVILVMEWIRGRTLEEMLSHGALPWRRAAALAAEIAEALEAIHRGGLVHRDLKPGNVMLTEDGHVKVIDFGVALHVFSPEGGYESAVASPDRLTAGDRRVGTLRHMSPEQLSGKTDLGARSDLFALGILLWETLTGAHPFLRPTSYETAAAIINDPPGSATDTASLPDVPRLRQVVLDLLEKDPARRPASAEAVAAELRAIASSAEAIVPGAVVEAAVQTKPRRWGVVGAVAALLVVAAVVGMLGRNRGGGGTTAELPAVAVLPFEDRDGASGSVRGELIASLVGAGLSESRVVRSVDLDRIISTLGEKAISSSQAGTAAAKLHAQWVVAGQVWTEGGTLTGTMRVFRAGRPEPVAEHPLRAGGPSGIAAIATSRTLEATDPGYRGDAASRVTASTRSDDAREQLTRARAALRIADYATAIASLERAVASDPSYVEARTALAGALYAAGWGRRSREEASRATQDADRVPGALPDRVVLEARATSARANEKEADELAARRLLVEKYRDDPALLIAYADSLQRAGQRDEALGIVAQAEALDPDDIRALLVRARTLTGAQRFDEARAATSQAAKALGPSGPPNARGLVAMQEGNTEMTRQSYPSAADRYGIAETLFKEAGAAVPAARAHRAVLDAEVVQGKLDIGPKDYEGSLQLFRSVGALQDVVDTLNVVGGRDLMAGELEKAEPTLRAAIQEARILENPSLVVYPQLNLALLLSKTGRISEAEGTATEAVESSRALGLRDPEAFGLTLLASVKLGKGRPLEARDAYQSIADLARAPGSGGERLGFALMGVADIDEMIGAPGDGLEAIEAAIKDYRSHHQSVELSYALLIRARLKSQIADWDGADADLAECQRLARTSGTSDEDLNLRIVLARAGRELRNGRLAEAAKEFEVVRKRGARLQADQLTAPAALGSCQVALALGHLAGAENACRAADSDPRAIPTERADAHALLAQIARASQNTAEATRLARRAAEEAESSGMAPTAIRALAVLSGIKEIPDRADAARRGTSLVASYFREIPEARRDAVRRRADWKSDLDSLAAALAAD